MIYAFLADGFEEIEAITPVDILRRAGFAVKTVGVTGEVVCGAHKICVKADLTLEDVDINKAELLFLPGGMPGTKNLQQSKKLEELILSADAKKIYIAAICAAPMILGELGLLKNRSATCFSGFEKHLQGAEILNKSVVCDGHVITSKGAGTAAKLGFKIVEILKNKKTADELSAAMEY